MYIRGEGPGPRVAPKAKRRRKREVAPAFGPISGQAQPFSRAQKQAKKRTEKAQSRLPPRPTPSIPVLRNPTPRQTAAANHLIARSVARQVAPGSGKQRRAQRDQIVRELKSDPRYRRALRAAQHYAVAQGRDLSAQGIPQRNARDRVGPGPLPRIGIGPVSIDKAALTKFLLGPARAQSGTATAPAVFTPTEAKRFGADVQTLGTGPFIGAYELGRAAYDKKVHGDSARLERLGTGVLKGVAESSPGKLAQGDLSGALEQLQQHPLIAPLDYAAAVSVVGRVTGAAARTATGGKVGGTVRPPRALSNDAGAVKAGSYVQREYSKGLDRQVVQRKMDARRKPVRDSRGKRVMVEQRGRKVPVLEATPGEMRRGNIREADYRVAHANAAERIGREKELRSTKVRGIRGQKARDLVAMVHEGTVPSLKHIDSRGRVTTGTGAFVRYLTDHADRLDAEYKRRVAADPKGYRHSGEAEANRYRAKLARDAAANPRVVAQAEKIVAAGTRSGEHGRKLDVEAHSVGVIDDLKRATGAALIPGKIEHLGGRHFTEKEHAKLERQALAHEQSLPEGSAARAAAREERIAVSGRHPEQVKAHEAARAKAETERGAEKKARARVASLERSRQRLVGAQASRRGRRQGEALKTELKSKTGARPEGHATAAEKTKLAKKDAQIKQARAEAVEHGKAARKAEHESRGTPMPPIREAVRTSQGKHLPDKVIEDFYRERGRDPETVGYLPHVPPGDRAFHQQLRPGSRPTADKPGRQGTRTGEAYRKGATEFSADLIQQQGVKLRTQIIKAHQLDQLIRERSLLHPRYPEIEKKAAKGEQLTTAEKRLLDNHGYFTGREAAEIGQRVLYDTSKRHGPGGLGPREVILLDGERYVPMTAHAGRLSDETKRIIHEDLQGPGAMESLHEHLFNDRVLQPDELGRISSRNVVLVPADTVDRYLQHLRPAGEIEKMLQMLNRPFRFAVLSQFKWLVGNFAEPYLVRLPGVGSGAVNVFGLANDIRISLKVVKEGMRSGDPRVRAAAEARLGDDLGGMLNNRGASNRRLWSDTKMYARIVQKVPATRQFFEMAHKLGQVLFAPARAFFWANREAIEKWAQHAALGRSERRAAVEFFGSWKKAVKFGKEATEEAVKGLTNTPRQHAFMREQHKLLGQYGGFSPRMRALVQGPMPFLPWALSAARFVFWTMPTQRTIQTALLLKTNDVVADEWKKQHEFLSPKQQSGTLGVDPVRKDQGITPMVRYTPYGLTAPILRGDLQGADYAFPAFSGVTAALQGKDPFGNDLKAPKTAENPQGTVTGLVPKGKVAANSLAEALVPYLAQARRLREGGETGYSTSNVLSPKTKPGTSHGMSAVRRTFDPFRPTYLRAGGGRVPPLSRKAARDLGLDKADLDELRRATAERGFDPADLEELRQLARGRP